MKLPLLDSILEFATARRVRVVGNSMSPTYREGQRLVISTRAYRHRRPQRFDAVLLDNDRQDLKRIVGLPGESVQLRSGELLINGQLLDEPHISMSAESTSADNNWKLGDSEYVVLGDNRRASTDSRDYGPVSEDQIVGPVIR